MINRVVLVGRITKELELKKTSNGKSAVSFSVAIDRAKDANGNKQTDFPSCRAYGKTAELLTQYCHKGSQVGVEGSIRTYTTESNGKKEYHTEVLADGITFLDSKGTQTDSSATSVIINDDDLPF